MKPIKILHILSDLTNNGGIQNLIIELYKSMDKEIFSIDFLVHDIKKTEFYFEVKGNGNHVYFLPKLNEVGPIKYQKEAYLFFKNHNDYDIVHSHLGELGGVLLQAAKVNNISCRFNHSHTNKYEYTSPISKLYKKYYCRFLLKKYTTHLIGCSIEAVNAINTVKDLNKITILKNAINLKKFSFNMNQRVKLRQDLGIQQEKVVLGHIGRLVPVKNQIFLLEIMQKLREKSYDFELIIVGDGPLRAELLSKIKEFKLDKNVKLLGARKDINSLLNIFDILLMPSLWEGIPLTLIEAQANGLKCLVSDTITKEIDTGIDLINFMGIKDQDIENWINTIIEVSNYNCNKRNLGQYCNELEFSALSRSGYCIEDYTEKLQNIYISSVKVV